jgi:hypothetical protein
MEDGSSTYSVVTADRGRCRCKCRYGVQILVDGPKAWMMERALSLVQAVGPREVKAISQKPVLAAPFHVSTV